METCYKCRLGMARSVDVDFQQSRIERLSAIKHRVPQIFTNKGDPQRAVNRYLREVARRVSRGTIRTYGGDLKEFCSWLENSDMKIEDVRVSDYEMYVDALVAYRKPGGEALSWNTVNARVGGAFRFLQWAYRENFCQQFKLLDLEFSNTGLKHIYRSRVLNGSHPSKAIQKPTDFLLIDDAIQFVKALGKETYMKSETLKKRIMLMGDFMLQTGIRVSEVCSFPLEELPQVDVKRELMPARITGKGDKRRIILIPKKLLLALWEYADIDRELIVEKSEDRNRTVLGNLFLSCDGKSLTRNWIEKIFRRVSTLNGISANPHILRHTFGTYHYLLNRDLSTLSKLMGHSSEETTSEYYVHTAMLISYAGTYQGFQENIDKEVWGG